MPKPEDLHPYDEPQLFERITPISEIPKKFQFTTTLPGGGKQIIDRRKAYNWNPTIGAMVECGSVAADAHKLLD